MKQTRLETFLEKLLKEGGEPEESKAVEGQERLDAGQVVKGRARSKWIVSKLKLGVKEPENTGPCYLLGSIYDGEKAKVLLKLYNPESKEIVFWYDKTGHKPYFLTDLSPDKVRQVRGIIGHPSFYKLETIERYDLLREEKRVLTKIVMKDPRAVRDVRKLVPTAWEAKIKYHINYIYDRELIPGLLYKVENGELVEYETPENVELVGEVEEAFKGEDEETRKLAISWLKLFQTPPPRIERVAIDIEVWTPGRHRIPNPRQASYPIISVAIVATDGLKRVLLLAREDAKWGSAKIPENVEVEVFDDERELLRDLFRVLNNYPVVLTFNGDQFDLRYVYHRALRLGMSKDEIPIVMVVSGDNIIARLKKNVHIDLYRFFENRAVQNYAFGGVYKEYTLEAIASAFLGYAKLPIDVVVTDLTLSELVAYNFRDAQLTLNLTLFKDELVMKLIILIMRISRLPIEDATRHQVSQWVKNLFYWEHRKRGYLIPNPEEIVVLKGEARTSAVIKGKKYAGAKVLTPKAGVYFDVVVLDFASLYPSIIKRWNLSYETVNCQHVECRSNLIPETSHWVCRKKSGITSQITGVLRDYRVKIFKKKAKDPKLPEDLRAWYDVVQAAMKVYINASYGVFGAETFPLYCPPAAESVTAIGRYTIEKSIDKARELGLKVLYGDTDSLFIWSPPRDALAKLEKWVEENFGLEIDVDKTYRYVGFTGLKKNYFGVLKDGGIDVKGLLGKKRNTPEFIKEAVSKVLTILSRMSGLEELENIKSEIRRIVQETYEKLKNREYTLDQLAIRVALTKPIESYDKSTPQHVKAAKELVKWGKPVQQGDVISIIKVKTRSGVKPIELARLSEVDIEKYVEHIRTAFTQILTALNIEFDEILGISKLESYFWK